MVPVFLYLAWLVKRTTLVEHDPVAKRRQGLAGSRVEQGDIDGHVGHVQLRRDGARGGNSHLGERGGQPPLHPLAFLLIAAAEPAGGGSGQGP
jgi:hypothetical protein